MLSLASRSSNGGSSIPRGCVSQASPTIPPRRKGDFGMLPPFFLLPKGCNQHSPSSLSLLHPGCGMAVPKIQQSRCWSRGCFQLLLSQWELPSASSLRGLWGCNYLGALITLQVSTKPSRAAEPVRGGNVSGICRDAAVGLTLGTPGHKFPLDRAPQH